VNEARDSGKIKEVKIAIVAGQGDHQEASREGQGARLQARLQGPAELVVLPATGHQVGLRTAPALWTAAVARTLDAAVAAHPR
jgi:pimeloyl-ACP methyl ester carboxylesterase